MTRRIRTERLASLPLRLSVIAGVFVFLVAIGTTQLALYSEHRETGRTIERMSQVYLDGLAAALRAGLYSSDPELMHSSLGRFFEEQRGIRERAIFLYSNSGQLIVGSGELGLEAEAREFLPSAMPRISTKDGIVWAARPSANPEIGHMVVALDIADTLQARTTRFILVYTVDVLVAGLFGVVAFVILRRLSAPIEYLLGALAGGIGGTPVSIPQEVVERANTTTRQVLDTYNRMVIQVTEREALAATAYEREQAAALGRLAATIAHEVRNPLGGLAAAVSTMRQFGEDPKVRAESLGLLARGIEMISHVVTSTLNLYRPDDERRLRSVDFQDLSYLVGPEARRKGLQIDFKLDIPTDISLRAGGIRQILLNLLLNACAATPPGGTVFLVATIHDETLVLEVRDQGRGMSPEGLSQLSDPAMTWDGTQREIANTKRIGISVIVSLLEHLSGRASVEHIPDQGTVVRVTIPIERAS